MPLVASLVAAGFADSLGVSAGILVGVGVVASGALAVGLRPAGRPASVAQDAAAPAPAKATTPTSAEAPAAPEEVAEHDEVSEEEYVEAVLVDGDEAEARWLFPTHDREVPKDAPAEPLAIVEEPAEEPAGSHDPGIDADSLMERIGGDKELLGELIGLFEMDTPHRLTALREAAADGDADGVARAAHGIKSGLSNFCAHGAQERAFVLERAGREGSLPEDAVEQVDALKECLDQVVVQLRDLCLESAA